MSDTPPEKSLRDELQRRKTQQLRQAQSSAADKRATQASPTPPAQPPASSPPPKSEPPTSQPSAPRATQTAARATQTTKAPVPSRPGSAGASGPSLTPMQMRLAVVAIVGLLAVVCIGTVLVSPTLQQPTLTPTNPVLPIITARDVLNYLLKVGVPILDVNELDVPNDTWGASQGLQFDVQLENNRGNYILLSYPTRDGASGAAFRSELDETYGEWNAYSISNILVLSTPETVQAVDRVIISHINTYIIGGVVDFWPTATGQFVAMAVTDEAATKTVLALTQTQTIFPTLERTVVTVTPRPPTETYTPSSTWTPRPTRLPNLPTETPTDTPTATATTPPDLGPTPSPTETVIVPVVVTTPTPDKSRAERFVAAAPRFLDPLRLDPRTITTDQYGATLTYVTNEGMQYPVVVWITGSVEAAKERFDYDLAVMSGGQAVALGERAILAPPGGPILAALLFQDMVLYIYNPEQLPPTVPPNTLSADYLIRMLQQLFVALPTRE